MQGLAAAIEGLLIAAQADQAEAAADMAVLSDRLRHAAPGSETGQIRGHMRLADDRWAKAIGRVEGLREALRAVHRHSLAIPTAPAVPAG